MYGDEIRDTICLAIMRLNGGNIEHIVSTTHSEIANLEKQAELLSSI